MDAMVLAIPGQYVNEQTAPDEYIWTMPVIDGDLPAARRALRERLEAEGLADLPLVGDTYSPVGSDDYITLDGVDLSTPLADLR